MSSEKVENLSSEETGEVGVNVLLHSKMETEDENIATCIIANEKGQQGAAKVNTLQGKESTSFHLSQKPSEKTKDYQDPPVTKGTIPFLKSSRPIIQLKDHNSTSQESGDRSIEHEFQALLVAGQRYQSFNREALTRKLQGKKLKSFEFHRQAFLTEDQHNRDYVGIDSETWMQLTWAIGMQGFTPEGLSFKMNLRWIRKYIRELLESHSKIPFIYVSVKNLLGHGRRVTLMDYTGNLTANIDEHLAVVLGRHFTYGTSLAVTNVAVSGSIKSPELVLDLSNIIGISSRIEFQEQEMEILLNECVLTGNVGKIRYRGFENGISVLELGVLDITAKKNEVDSLTVGIVNAHVAAKLPVSFSHGGKEQRESSQGVLSPVNKPITVRSEDPSEDAMELLSVIANKRPRLMETNDGSIDFTTGIAANIHRRWIPKRPVPLHRKVNGKNFECKVKERVILNVRQKRSNMLRQPDTSVTSDFDRPTLHAMRRVASATSTSSQFSDSETINNDEGSNA